MAAIRLQSLGMTYPPGVVALADVDLVVEPGQWLVIMGHSGCGKSTLLRLIAGLDEPTQGSIELHGRPAKGVPPHQRDVALLFQKAPLLPGRTVRDNLALAFTLRQPIFRQRLSPEQDRELNGVADQLRLQSVLDRLVHQLSGGQQQRVALGRILLRRAKICLFDEPLGHLDAPLRTELRRQIQMLGQRTEATTLYVTHDPAEALALGERIAVFHEGRLQQVGKPDELLDRPANRFVAQVCHYDRDELNFLQGNLVAESGGNFFASVLGRFPVPAELTATSTANLAIVAGIPSEDLRIHAASTVGSHTMPTSKFIAHADEVMVPMRVALLEFAPHGSRVILERDGARLSSWSGGKLNLSKGQSVMVAISLKRAMWFLPETGRTLHVSNC